MRSGAGDWDSVPGFPPSGGDQAEGQYQSGAEATGPELAIDGTPLWDGYVNERDKWLRRAYGMKLEHYELLLANQNGRCGICDKRPRSGRHLVVDHDHDTGEIRGLLCERCNLLLTQRLANYINDPPGRRADGGPFFLTAEVLKRLEEYRKAKALALRRRRAAKQKEVTLAPVETGDYEGKVAAALKSSAAHTNGGRPHG